MMPVADSLDDGEQFAIVDVVIQFGGLQRAGKECDWVVMSIVLQL